MKKHRTFIGEALDPSEDLSPGERIFGVAFGLTIGPWVHVGNFLNKLGIETDGDLDHEHFTNP